MKKQIQVPYVYVPIDEEGYTQSFTINQLEEAKEFFDEFGFVVFSDAISPEACKATISEIFDVMEQNSDGFDRNDMSTWDAWPEESIERYGNISRPSLFSRQFIENRMNPNLHTFCSAIIGDDDLIVSHDRACFYRPTTNVMINGQLTQKGKWKTITNIHLDMNPWQWRDNDSTPIDERNKLKYYSVRNWINENNFPAKEDGISLQGSINLIDNRDEDGGFLCVPGFHNILEEFFETIPKNGEGPSYGFNNKDQNIQSKKIRISQRAGSIVLWDQRMAHGASRNLSDIPRAAQFFRMFKKSTMTEERAKKRRNALINMLNKIPGTIEINENGMRVFDLQNETVYGTERSFYC